MGILKITGTLKNCTCNFRNGDTFKKWDNIQLIAEPGYTFPVNRQYDYSVTMNGNTKRGLTISADRKNIAIMVSDQWEVNFDENYECVKGELPAFLVTSGTYEHCHVNEQPNWSNHTGWIDCNVEPLKIIADEGYEMDGSYEYELNFKNLTLTANKQPEIVFPHPDSGQIQYAFYGKTFTAKKAAPKDLVHISTTFEHCSCNRNDGDLFNSSNPVIITADEGFLMDGVYRYRRGNIQSKITANKQPTITINWEDTGLGNNSLFLESPFVAKAKEPPKYYVHITGTFTNCHCNKQDGNTFGLDDPIVITADDGFIFDTPVQYSRGNILETVEPVDNTYTIEWKDNSPFSSDIYLNGVYEGKEPPFYTSTVTVTGSTKFCTINKQTGDICTTNDPIIISGLSGSKFSGNFEYNENGVVKTVSCETPCTDIKIYPSANGDILLNSKYEATPPENVFFVFIEGSFVNCTCNKVNNDLFTENEPVIITADENFIFDDTPFSYILDNVERTVKSSDGKTLVINYETESGYSRHDLYLTDIYTANKPIESPSGFTHLYAPTDDELNQLAKTRYVQNFDYGSYILGLFKIPFSIPDSLNAGCKSIILGNLKTDVQAISLTDYVFTVDLGEIFIPSKYNNVYDYVDTDCYLYLPFFNKIYLSTENVINQTLHITMTIELFSGNATVNIFSSFCNEIIESISKNISLEIPFMQNSNGNVVNRLSGIYVNNIAVPFVEIVRNIPYENTNVFFGKDVNETMKLATLKGYCEVDNIILESSATSPEKEEIRQILKRGVYIK